MVQYITAVLRLGWGRRLGVSREQRFTDSRRCPYFDLGLKCAGFFKPVKRVEDRLPIGVLEIILDLVDVEFRCFKPIERREVVRVGKVVTTAVQFVSALNLKSSEIKKMGGK